MNELTEKQLCCPYCGETIRVLIDPEEVGDHYIEDCQVCCAPILFEISEGVDGMEVRVFSQDEAP